MSEDLKDTELEPQRLFDYCSGKLLPEEEKLVESQLSEQDGGNRLLALTKRLLALDYRMQLLSEVDTDKAYRRVTSRMHAERRRHIYSFFSRVAAVLFIPLLLLSVWLLRSQWRTAGEGVSYVEVSVAPGTMSKYQLPDNTRVWLNSGSWLRYPTRFDSASRRVEMRGEAYFEVTADKEHPFYVSISDGLCVKVTGTRFNVNAYDDESVIEVALEEGRVDVGTDSGEMNHTLKSGECFFYDREEKSSRIKAVETYEKTAWKDGKIVFRNAPLDNIFRSLARRYNGDINFVNKGNVEYNYRATFTGEDIYQILDYLSMTVPMKWEVVAPAADGNTLSRKRINIYLE